MVAETTAVRTLASQRTPLGRDIPLIVGWGAHDRFADGIDMVTAGLLAAQRFVLPGRHDWPVWVALWRAVLDRFGATIDATTPEGAR